MDDDNFVGPPATVCDISPALHAELTRQAQDYVMGTRSAFDLERKETHETMQRVEAYLDKRIDDVALIAVVVMCACCATVPAVLLWALFRRSEEGHFHADD